VTTPRYRVDPELKKYGTAHQIKCLEAVNEHRSYSAAARALGLGRTTVQDAITALEKKAALCGYAPDFGLTHPAPAPFMVKGVSTLYDQDGNQKAQWVKTAVDDEKREAAIRAAVEAMAEEVVRAKPTPAPKSVSERLCNLFTLTDCHVGMRSWKHETGENWDLEIAEQTLLSAFSHLVRSTPKARVAFVNQLGDFLHFDSLSPVTPASGHVLDADSRYEKVVKTATKILRSVVDEALSTHEEVIVLLAEGNHDPASSVWLRHLFSCIYEKEPRVKVIESAIPYYAYQHGQVMLAFHHGHLKKNDALPLLFAAQFPSIWGDTKKRYCHTGHWHHTEEKEHNGMKVMQHATIAARDAYASRGGWLAERQITAVTYHNQFGQVGTATVVPEMLEAA
jgi:hypothetical protein